MKNHLLSGLFAAGVLAVTLTGCGKKPVPQPEPSVTVPPTTEAVVVATTPADGNPNDVTCKGSYTGQPDGAAVVARVGDRELTNEVLSAYYWAEVSQYCDSGETPMPDLSQPLDTQVCERDSSVGSWQQYFLRRALNSWHSSVALILQGEAEGLPTEEAYQPNLEKHEENLQDIPATKYLYRYQKAFQPNTLHQAYLDGIGETLETLAGEKGYGSGEEMARTAFGASLDAVEEFMEDYNRGYMYYTNLSYYIEVTDEEIETAMAALAAENALENGDCVNFRHILLLPGEEGDEVTRGEDGTVTCAEELWTACEEKAQKLLKSWASAYNSSEATFADLAYHNSRDEGTAKDGGAYDRVRRGQLNPVLEDWCFAEGRKAGDTEVFRSPYGVHILYFSGSESMETVQAENAAIEEKQAEFLTLSRSTFPMEVSYSAITLSEGSGGVSLSDVLYPDIAHERFPEVPVYLQQDYPTTKYGNYLLRTNGCGITSLAMVASYLSDEEWTPPELCARYGNYSHVNGTDGMIFIREAPVLGFYFREKLSKPELAHEALEDGYIVVSVHKPGYWTRGGHYIVIEKLLDGDMVQVRDSNLYNYGRLPAHKQDQHRWADVVPTSHGYWVFEKKTVEIPACSRCGSEEGHTRDFLAEDYICRKCAAALLRRNTYLSACGE